MDEALAVAMPNRLRVSGEERSAEKCDEKNEQRSKVCAAGGQKSKVGAAGGSEYIRGSNDGSRSFHQQNMGRTARCSGFVRQNRILTCRTESVPGHRF